MAAPRITVLPTPPNTQEPASFPTRASAFFGALLLFRTQINNLATYLDNLALATGPGIFKRGSETKPSITIQGDTNTGIYSPGANQIAIAHMGRERFRFWNDVLETREGSRFLGQGGTPAKPVFALGEDGMGFYRLGPGHFGASIYGSTAFTIAPAGATIGNSQNVVTREKGDGRYTLVASSLRYKENVHDAEPRDLSSLTCKAWTWGGEIDGTDARRGRAGAGLIAEELAEVAPDCVTRTSEGEPDGIQVLALVGHMVDYYNGRIAALEARVAALEGV